MFPHDSFIHVFPFHYFIIDDPFHLVVIDVSNFKYFLFKRKYKWAEKHEFILYMT